MLKTIIEEAAKKKANGGSGPVSEATERVVKAVGMLPYGEAESIFDESYGTGWFTNIVMDKAHNRLMKGYATPKQWWRLVSEIVDLEDLKTHYATAFSGSTYLPAKAHEHAGYESAYYADRAENYTPDELGRIFEITKKLKANDQIGAFMKWGEREGKAWTHSLNRLVFYTNLSANPTMSDSNSLFDATNHSNKTAAGSGTISRATLATLYSYIGLQTGDAGEKVADEGPWFLVVTPENTVTAMDITSTVVKRASTSVETGEPNVFGTGGEIPVQVIPTAWADGSGDASDIYLLSGSFPLFEVGFLNGKDTPSLMQELPGSGFSFTHDKYRWRVTGDFGATALDWRGMAMGDAA